MQMTYDLFAILFHCPLKRAQDSRGDRLLVTVSSYTMVAHRSITGYFGAPVKQLKRKGNPSAENTGVIEKKHCDSPTIPVRKFRVSWKETFPCWVVHDVNDNTL